MCILVRFSVALAKMRNALHAFLVVLFEAPLVTLLATTCLLGTADPFFLLFPFPLTFGTDGKRDRDPLGPFLAAAEAAEAAEAAMGVGGRGAGASATVDFAATAADVRVETKDPASGFFSFFIVGLEGSLNAAAATAAAGDTGGAEAPSFGAAMAAATSAGFGPGAGG